MNSNTPAPPTPQPLCAAFAPLLPLLNTGELGPEQAASLRDHLATCAWCRVQLAGYDVIDSAARRHYAGTPAATPLFQPQEIEKMLDEPTAPTYEPLPTHSRTPRSPRPRRLPAFSAVAAAILVAALAGLFFSRHGGLQPGAQKTLQHDGGLRITFSLACPASQPECDMQRLSAQTRDILQKRAMEGLGVPDAVARLDGNTTIVVELPGYNTDAHWAVALLAQTGELDFIDTGGIPLQIGTDVSTKLCTDNCTPGQYKILFTGAQLNPASCNATLDLQSKLPIVTFAFAPPYQQQFAEYTRQHVGQYLTIALDDKVIESATIQSEIADQGQIIGFATMDNAQAFVVMLKYHALPLFLKVSKEEYVSPVPTSTPVSEWRNMVGAYVFPASTSTQ